MEDPSTVVKARKELAEKRHYAYKVRAEAATKIQTWYKSSKRNRIYSNQVKLQDEQLSTYHCEKENDYCSDTESNKLTDYSVDSEKFINVQTDTAQEEDQLTGAPSDRDTIQTDSSFDDYVNNELCIALAVINQKPFSSLTRSQQERVQRIQRGINPNPELDSSNVRKEDTDSSIQSSFVHQREIEPSESISSDDDEHEVTIDTTWSYEQLDHKAPQSDGFGPPLSVEQGILLREVSKQLVSNSCQKPFAVNEEHGPDSSQQDNTLSSELSQHVVNPSLQQANEEVNIQAEPTRATRKKATEQQNAFSRIPIKINGRRYHTITSTARENATRGMKGNHFRERIQFKNKGKHKKLEQSNRVDEDEIDELANQPIMVPFYASQHTQPKLSGSKDTCKARVSTSIAPVRLSTKEGWKDRLSTCDAQLEVNDMISKFNDRLPISDEEASPGTSTSHESNIVQGISSENCLVVKTPSLGASYDYQDTANDREDRSHGMSYDQEDRSHGMSYDQEEISHCLESYDQGEISHCLESYDQDKIAPYEGSSSESDTDESCPDNEVPTSLTGRPKQIQTTSDHNVVPMKYRILSPFEMSPTEHGDLKKRPSNKGRVYTKKTAQKTSWTTAEMVDAASQTDSVDTEEISTAIPSPIPCLTQPTTSNERKHYVPPQPLHQLRYQSLHLQKNRKGKKDIRSLQTPALNPLQKKQACGYLGRYLHAADDHNGHLTTKSAPGYATNQFAPASLPSLTDLSLPWYNLSNAAPPSLLGGPSPLHVYRSPLDPVAKRKRLSVRPFNRHLGRQQPLKPIKQYSPRSTCLNMSLESANYDGQPLYGDPLQTQLTTNYYNKFQGGNRRL